MSSHLLRLSRSRTVSGTSSGRATLRWPSTFSLTALSFSRSVHQKCRCSLLAFVCLERTQEPHSTAFSPTGLAYCQTTSS